MNNSNKEGPPILKAIDNDTIKYKWDLEFFKKKFDFNANKFFQ